MWAGVWKDYAKIVGFGTFRQGSVRNTVTPHLAIAMFFRAIAAAPWLPRRFGAAQCLVNLKRCLFSQTLDGRPAVNKPAAPSANLHYCQRIAIRLWENQILAISQNHYPAKRRWLCGPRVGRRFALDGMNSAVLTLGSISPATRMPVGRFSRSVRYGWCCMRALAQLS